MRDVRAQAHHQMPKIAHRWRNVFEDEGVKSPKTKKIVNSSTCTN